jgi:hypothetical protein
VLNIEWTLFILARLIASEQLTPEELGDRIPMDGLADLPAVLDALGFKKPQATPPSTGESSTP